MPKKISHDAMERLFHRQYICMRCNAKIRANPQKVKAGKVKCRKCGYKGLRPKKKEMKAAAK
ncbi:MAG: 50S ribosomal protein L40e [Candidatus Aenigmarchaeota archaeon ex4484_14]|nr:MAG: 50S ribosomal protein L40e [Candidatus Aenigmarchaeota archaeon ex4484_14]